MEKILLREISQKIADITVFTKSMEIAINNASTPFSDLGKLKNQMFSHAENIQLAAFEIQRLVGSEKIPREILRGNI